MTDSMSLNFCTNDDDKFNLKYKYLQILFNKIYSIKC